MSGNTNRTLMEYIRTLDSDDIPDILSLVEHDPYYSLQYGIRISTRMPQAEEYIRNGIWASERTKLLIALYEEKFNISLDNKE